MVFALILIVNFLSLAYKKVTITCYLFDPCGGCSVEENPCKACETETLYRNKYLGIIDSTGLAQRVDFRLYNTLYDKNLKAYQTDMQRLGFSSDIMPVMSINGIVLEGDKEISERMEAVIKDTLFLPSLMLPNKEKKGETEIKDIIILFKTTGCEDCNELENFINETIPESLKNKFIEFDITEDNNYERFRDYCVVYDANTEYLVPAIFVNEHCLVGSDQIEEYIISNVKETTEFYTKVLTDELY